MFVDELFEKYLVEEKWGLRNAIWQVFVDKIEKESDKTLENIKMIENGYQCFRRKHPEFPQNAVKAYVLIKSPGLCKLLNW